MKKYFDVVCVLFVIVLFSSFALGCGKSADSSINNTSKENVNITEKKSNGTNITMPHIEDGMIQETNIFYIEKQLKSIDGYEWSEEHGVIEGRTGYFGTILCEDNDIWCHLYGNDLEEIKSASLRVHVEDIELLLTFVTFFETSLIDTDEVKEWVNGCLTDDIFTSKVFGDATFYLESDLEAETIKISIHALE